MKILPVYQSSYKTKNSYLINKNFISTSPSFRGSDLKEALKGLAFGTLMTAPFSCAHICKWKMEAMEQNQQNQVKGPVVPGDSLIKQSSNTYQPEISEFYAETIGDNSVDLRTIEEKNTSDNSSNIQSKEPNHETLGIVENDTTKQILQNSIIKEKIARLDSLEKVLIDKNKISDDKLDIINKKLKELDLKQEELDSLKNIIKEQTNITNDSVQYSNEIDNFFKEHSGDDNKIDIDEFVTMLENIQTILKEHDLSDEVLPSVNINSLKEENSEIDVTKLENDTNTKNSGRNQWYHNREYYNNGSSQNDIIEVIKQDETNTNISSQNQQYQNREYSNNNSSISKVNQREPKDTTQNKKSLKEKSFNEILWHTWFINNFINRFKK